MTRPDWMPFTYRWWNIISCRIRWDKTIFKKFTPLSFALWTQWCYTRTSDRLSTFYYWFEFNLHVNFAENLTNVCICMHKSVNSYKYFVMYIKSTAENEERKNLGKFLELIESSNLLFSCLLFPYLFILLLYFVVTRPKILSN